MIKYFETRKEAREAGKVIDNGKDSPKGKRWAVEVEDVQDVVNVSNEHIQSAESTVTPDDIAQNLHAESGSIIGEQVLKSPNKKPVRVSWRRNLQIMRLRAHLDKTA